MLARELDGLRVQDVAGYTLLMRAAEWGWRDVAGAVLQAAPRPRSLSRAPHPPAP